MKRKLPIFLVLSFLFLFHIHAQEVEDLGFSPEQLEERLVDLLNHERLEKGLTDLTLDTTLRELARAHSRKMAAENKLSHQFPNYPPLNERAVDAGLFFSELGENVASGEIFVMRFVHQALMDSPAHRKNILKSEYSKLGIGIIKQGDVYYTTQVFAHLIQPKTAEEIEAELLKKISEMLPLDKQTPLLDIPELKKFCRKRAADFMNAISFNDPLENWPWGKTELMSHTFFNPEDAMSKLLTELSTENKGWILGAAFGRTPTNPGGVYSVTLVIFPKLVALDDPHRSFFDLIVNHPATQDKAKIKYSEALAKLAFNIASSYEKNNQSYYDYPAGCKFCYIYDAFDFEYLPNSLLDIFAKKHIKSLGIHVLYPQAQSFRKNTLIIAVVGN